MVPDLSKIGVPKLLSDVSDKSSQTLLNSNKIKSYSECKKNTSCCNKKATN